MLKSVIVSIIIQILLISPALAEEKAVTMRTMIGGMNLIQLGFLTNTETLIEQGVFEVNYSKSILDAFDKTMYMSLDVIQHHEYTKKMSAQITIHADLLLKEYKAREVNKAMQEYQSLMNTCINCHMKLRDFKDRGDRFK